MAMRATQLEGCAQLAVDVLTYFHSARVDGIDDQEAELTERKLQVVYREIEEANITEQYCNQLRRVGFTRSPNKPMRQRMQGFNDLIGKRKAAHSDGSRSDKAA